MPPIMKNMTERERCCFGRSTIGRLFLCVFVKEECSGNMCLACNRSAEVIELKKKRLPQTRQPLKFVVSPA